MSIGGARGNEDLRFMPEVEAARRRRGNRYTYMLTVITFLFCVAFVVWAKLAVLDEVTRGDGTIIPSSKTQVIQNLEGGILADILVREGHIVEKGDILVRIDNTVAQANFRDARTQSLALSATVARLAAELAGEEQVEFSPEVAAEAPGAMADQQSIFLTRKNQLSAQTRVLEAQAKQRRLEIAEMRSRRDQVQNSLNLAKQELAITRHLVKKGILPRLELIRIDRQVADFDGEIRTIKITIPRLQAAAEEAKQRVQELLLTRRAEVSNELNVARAELKSVGEALSADRDRVTRTEVRSPVRGTIKEIKHNTVGGVIRPGQDILEIVPLDDTLLVEAQIRPADIAFLRPGQTATIKITAYDFSIFGGLEAKLEQISADTIKDEDAQSDERFYRVYLRTQNTVLVHQGDSLPIIPGMTASVEILTGKKTVFDYLMKPILKARDRALKER